MTNFTLFQIEEFADNNFKSDENCKMFSGRVENTVLVMSDFSFSHSVFKRLVLLKRLELWVWFWQETRLFFCSFIIRLCRWQIQIQWKWQKVLPTGRKHRGKRRKCLLQAISPFPTVFSKDLYCRHVKNQGLFGKGLIASFQLSSAASLNLGRSQDGV